MPFTIIGRVNNDDDLWQRLWRTTFTLRNAFLYRPSLIKEGTFERILARLILLLLILLFFFFFFLLFVSFISLYYRDLIIDFFFYFRSLGARALSENELDSTLSKDETEKDSQVESLLVDRIARFFQNHILQFKVPDSSINEVRKSLDEGELFFSLASFQFQN